MRRVNTLLALASWLALLWAAPAQAQGRGKEIVVGLGAEPRTMLAVTIVDWTTNNMLEHIYDRLLDRDAKTLKPRPMLATGWKIVNDTTWEFALRQGVKFHNGEPFNAQSVKATLEYALDPATKSHYAASAYWKPVKEVQIVNDYTVRLVTEKPWPSLIDHASLTNSLMMPAKALKEQGAQALAQKPLGTGPFKFVEWKRDDRLVLERNPDYWQGPADVSRVTFRFIPEFSARLAALLSGEIDVMKDVPPHAIEAVDPSGRAKVRSTGSSRINDVSLAIAAQLQRLGIKVNVVVNEWGTHLDKIKNRNTGDMFFLGWGPALWGQGTMEPLFKADQTYASFGNNKVIDEKIARAVTIVDPKGRAAGYAELQKLVRDEAPWVFLWQQHDLYGVASHVDWTPRADEKVWMYEAKVTPR